MTCLTRNTRLDGLQAIRRIDPAPDDSIGDVSQSGSSSRAGKLRKLYASGQSKALRAERGQAYG